MQKFSEVTLMKEVFRTTNEFRRKLFEYKTKDISNVPLFLVTKHVLCHPKQQRTMLTKSLLT
jgi:hypothetical protein